jgi:hypothetical protein
MRTHWGQIGSKKMLFIVLLWVDKYIKQGSCKYPKKAVKRGREGEDHSSPKLEMMVGTQMVGNGCGGVEESGGVMVKLWGEGGGCKNGGWGTRGRVTHHGILPPPGAQATLGMCSWVW